jgi:hypothetical protein
MNVREKLVELLTEFYGVDPMYHGVDANALADHLIAHGVTMQECGSWKYYHKQNKAVCTNCSFERDLDANFGKAITCPNCSAYMP